VLALGLMFTSGCGKKEPSVDTDKLKAELAKGKKESTDGAPQGELSKSATNAAPAPAPAPTQAAVQPTIVESVSGKLYVTSAGDLIKFWDNGIAVEINGEFGVVYAGQAIYFGEDGHSPRTQCPYKQDGAKITLTIKDDGTTAVFTVNKDGSLTGPPEGIWGHTAFASLTPKS